VNLKSQFEAMLASEAWKKLEQWVAEEQERSITIVDAIPAKDISSNHYCEERGLRKGMAKVLQQAHFFAEGR
jgi:cell wall assembly regulator SMI1